MDDSEVAHILQALYVVTPEHINKLVDIADLFHKHDEDCNFNRFTLTEFLNFVQPWVNLNDTCVTKKTEYNIIRVGFCENLGIEEYQHVHYFDAKSGEHLGITKEGVASNCNNKGEVFMAQENFQQAAVWFEKAYFACKVGSELEYIYLDNKDSANFAKQAVELKQENKLIEAIDMYKKAVANCHIFEVKLRFKKQMKDLQNEVDEIKNVKFSKMWDKAWKAEENGDIEESSILFETLLKECEHYKEWSNLVSLKISGNNEFNNGVAEQLLGCEVLDQANSEKNYIKKKEHFIKALEHFKSSEACFLAGYNIQSDSRFSECVTFVQDSIVKIENAISKHHAQALNKNIQKDVKVTSIKEKGGHVLSKQFAIPCLGNGIN